MTPKQPLPQAWDDAQARYLDWDAPAARFNHRLLTALRERWEDRIRPMTSMSTLRFTRPDESPYPYPAERVDVVMEGTDVVRMELLRMVPQRGQAQPAGPVTVTGDYTRADNAVPAVEALLMQLVGDDH
jgi:hypothetical protein